MKATCSSFLVTEYDARVATCWHGKDTCTLFKYRKTNRSLSEMPELAFNAHTAFPKHIHGYIMILELELELNL